MQLTRTAQKYQKEIKTLAESLPFKRLKIDCFDKAAFIPVKIRQPRTFTSHEAGMQAVGRFLTDRGTVDLLRPEDTQHLFTELHWCADRIRRISNKRFRTAREWHNALIEARRHISEIEAAEEELFIANRRLVVACIKPYYWIGPVWLPDFLQEGSKALANAVRKFDFTRGTPFYAYAQKSIQNRLRNFFRDHIRSGCIGIRPTREMIQIKEIIDTWNAEQKKKPDLAILAKVTGLPEQRIQKLLPVIRQWELAPKSVLSLDADIGDDSANLYEFIEDKDAETASDAVQRSEIWAAIDQLSPRAKFVMRLRFIEGRTLEETGNELGLTRARIKQIQDEALRKLRQMLRRGVPQPKM